MIHLGFFKRLWLSSWPHRLSVRLHVPSFLKSCPEPIRGQVLEVGAGKGATSRLILDTFPQVELTATDVDEEAVSHVQSFVSHYGRRLKVNQADVFALPFDRAAFDIALAINLFWQLQGEEIAMALRQIIRAVKPGGLIGISQSGVILGYMLDGATLESIAISEGCEVISRVTGKHYYLWLRRP